MRRQKATFRLLVIATAITIITSSLLVQIANSDDSESFDFERSSGHHSVHGPSNIKPVDLKQFAQYSVDRQSAVSDWPSDRMQFIPGVTDLHLGGFYEILDRVVGKLLDVQSDQHIGSKAEFAYYAMTDTSNDHLARATTQEIIFQAGFDSEIHYVESTDGYITEMIRIINPLADPSRLKQPPVAMYHGILGDTSLWVTSSTTQHHPEKWPRDIVADGLMTSWNRSLGFVLANNGYDVWLVGTRGCNRSNQGHRTIYKPWSIYGDNLTVSDVMATLEYWQNFTIDDIGMNEVPGQLDRIMDLTGSPKISVVSYSVSTLTTLALLSERPEYSRKIHNYVAMDIPMSERNANNLAKILYRTACQLDYFDGTLLLTETILSQQFRDAVLAMAKSKTLRYTLFRWVVNLLAGPSTRFNTLWELNLIGHNFWPVGFKEVKHLCQILSSNRFHKFDYGFIENHVRYGSHAPPDYDLSKVKPGDNWFIITSKNDPFSTPEDIETLIRIVGKQPHRHLYLPDNNHIDMVYAVDTDIRVNLPILEFLNRFSHESDQYESSYRSDTNTDLDTDPSLGRLDRPDDRVWGF